ncbi:MAG: MerR family transcriptional regulator [Chloroflexota bacterium]
MIRIGDFSKLSRIPVKTLRYYDEMELLKPIHVDVFTGYRYYEYEQIARLNRILALKDLGFSLEQIGQLLDAGLSPEQMRGMLILRQSEIRQRVQEEAERLARVESRLRQIEQENEMSKYDVVVKHVDAIRIASVRGVVPTPPDQSRLWGELGQTMAKQGIKPVGACLSLYHDEDHKERDWDIEVCEPVAEEVTTSRGMNVYELPAVPSMVCAIHHGPFQSLNEAYDVLMKWVDENGYRINGPIREVYLRPSENESQTDPNTVTEIQVPVTKA